MRTNVIRAVDADVALWNLTTPTTPRGSLPCFARVFAAALLKSAPHLGAGRAPLGVAVFAQGYCSYQLVAFEAAGEIVGDYFAFPAVGATEANLWAVHGAAEVARHQVALVGA